MRIVAASLAASLLAACAAVGPDYVAPATDPVSFKNAGQPGFTAGEVDAAWWRQFEDPILDDLVARARAGNNDLAVALARLRQARALFSGSERDRWPTVTAAAGYEGGRLAEAQTLPGQPRKFETYTTGFDASWEIDLFGRVRRGIEAARADTESAEASLRDVQVTLAGDVARNYFQLRSAQRRLDVARQNLDNERETLRITRARYDAGRGTELDVASATARVQATEATVPPLEAEAKRAQHRLAILTGVRPGELAVDLSPRAFPPLAKEIPIGRPEDLLRRRPDIRVAERNLAAATARVGVATADLFPRVTLTGFLGFVATRGGALGSAGSSSWFGAPSLSWAAFDLGRARDRLHASEAVADQQLATYRQTVLLALEETENAFVNYGAAQNQMQHLLEQARYSARAAQIAQTRYREGVTDFLTLLDAQRTQLQAEDAVAQAEAQVYTGVVAIYKALGGGWQRCADAACGVALAGRR